MKKLKVFIKCLAPICILYLNSIKRRVKFLGHLMRKIPWTSYEEERLGRLNLHRAYGVKDEQGKKNSYLPDGFVWMDGGTGAWDLVKGKIW